MNFSLTDQLREEYQQLFNTCVIRPEHLPEVSKTAADLFSHKSRYQAVASQLNIPWYFVGAIHCMEASLSFETHLHNGDPLTARTVHVPANRPVSGQPPFTWEQSAMDALIMRNVQRVTDWTLPSLLFELEAYNGFGYRRLDPSVPTPYLWSFSQNYTSGKFVQDGKFDPDAISKQCGAAVIVRQMVSQGMISSDNAGNPLPDSQTAIAETKTAGAM